VIDAQTQATLQEVLRRESRSLLSYVADAYPWTTAAGGPALASLNRHIREELAAVNALGRFLVRHRIDLPLLGQYPVAFTTCNFIALSYLLPRLADEERRSIAHLEADLRAIHDPAAREPVDALLAVKKRNLSAMEALLAPQPEPASV
jgi:hypothetical protein